jgi:putative membrane protein
MRFFSLLTVLVIMALAIFAVQNSTASTVVLKFLIWQFETSLVYAILGAIGSGMVIILLLWIPSTIKGSFRVKKLKKEIEALKAELDHQKEATKSRGQG